MLSVPNGKAQNYLACILSLGLTSGAMFVLVSFTIPYQLAEAGYSTNIIGSMFLAALPYCLKPLCAPFIDKYSVPILCKRFGKKRGWALIFCFCLLLSISGLFFIEPTNNLITTGILVVAISFFASNQDIVIDAYRIERSKTTKELSIASAFSGAGFRAGIFLGSTGALYLSYIFNWRSVYISFFCLAIIAPITILMIEETEIKNQTDDDTGAATNEKFYQIIRKGLSSLKLEQAHLGWIVLFVFLYKASDSIPMAMSSPLFLDLSFTTKEIAFISKGYGLMMLVFGSFASGILTSKVGISRSILICGSLQVLSPLMFMLLSIAGHDLLIFTIVNTVQNFCCGLGSTTLLIYLSSLCNGRFIATQFAVISSFNSFARIILAFLSGHIAAHLEWTQFFLLNALLSILFILVFLRIYKP